MRLASAALTAFLDASPPNLECVQIDLYTFLLASGEIFRWSGGDVSLTVPAGGFPTGSLNYGLTQNFTLGPRFGRTKTTNKIGVAPAELDIDVYAGAQDQIGTIPFAEAALLGLFDGATVELDRFFAPAQPAGSGMLNTTLGCLLWFYGRVADIDIGRTKIALKVKSLMNLLALQQMPRRLYGAACTHIFGDAMCGYNRVTGENAAATATGPGQVTIAAAGGTTQSLITWASAPASPTAYVQGTVTGAAGNNAGYSRTIANLGNGSQVAVLKPFFYPIAPGDTFSLLPGCDHTTATCNGVFQNILRYGGFPYIPPPESAF